MTDTDPHGHAGHWRGIYADKGAHGVSWYRARLDTSLALIDALALPRTARIVDAGGGASTLVDDLLERGFSDVTVVDVAPAALDVARTRLGERGREAAWIAGDVTKPLLASASVDLWHDRAVFHFLTDESRREAYVARLIECVRPGGHVMIATFGLDGPERCSGLPVQRYDADGIARALGVAFEKVGEAHEVHVTPKGGLQAFTYCVCRKR